jgi:hypothetical protein
MELRKSKCGDGLGAYLTAPVQDGEVVFCVPSEAFYSASSALSHPLLGSKFQQLWEDTELEDPKGTSVLAAFIAHLKLNKDETSTPPSSYLHMLPSRTHEDPHALWWSETELDLISAASWFEEWVELRADVDEMSAALCAGVLSGDVAKHGNETVKVAVRAAFVAVLSRAYGVHSSDGREYKTLVPLLDALNHAENPNMKYHFEGTANGSGMNGVLVATAIRSLNKGEELTITYGDHPKHVFGLYWGFVPLSKESRLSAEEPSGFSESVRPCCVSMARALLASIPEETDERGAVLVSVSEPAASAVAGVFLSTAVEEAADAAVALQLQLMGERAEADDCALAAKLMRASLLLGHAAPASGGGGGGGDARAAAAALDSASPAFEALMAQLRRSLNFGDEPWLWPPPAPPLENEHETTSEAAEAAALTWAAFVADLESTVSPIAQHELGVVLARERAARAGTAASAVRGSAAPAWDGADYGAIAADWRMLHLWRGGAWVLDANAASFPATCAALRRCLVAHGLHLNPMLNVACGVARQPAGTGIARHCDGNLLGVTVHLGLDVPPPNPAGERAWIEVQKGALSDLFISLSLSLCPPRSVLLCLFSRFLALQSFGARRFMRAKEDVPLPPCLERFWAALACFNARVAVLRRPVRWAARGGTGPTAPRS